MGARDLTGIETVVIPRRNVKDLVDVPDEVRDALDVRPVDTIEEALGVTLGLETVPPGADAGRAVSRPAA